MKFMISLAASRQYISYITSSTNAFHQQQTQLVQNSFTATEHRSLMNTLAAYKLNRWIWKQTDKAKSLV